MISDSSSSLPNRATTGLLLSGGLDSAILLGYLLGQAEHVQPFYVRSNLLWERAELRAVGRLLQGWASPRLAELVVLEMPLGDLYRDHWSVTGREVPAAGTADEAVYLPGRNALLLVKAALWCQLHGIARLALGSLASNPFADATDDFFGRFEALLNQATGGSVQIVRPLAGLGKREVMALGRNYPLGETFSCLAPRDGLHCGACNKCAERQAAFAGTAGGDPTPYAAAAPVAGST